MNNQFFEKPILNSPYGYPSRHWELDASGQPTQRIIESRRRADFITPIPKPKKRTDQGDQASLVFDEGKGLSTDRQRYDHTAIISAVRQEVDRWRALPNTNDWRVTPETARLLQHWRQHRFINIRPFFCQIEAVETAIWLTEVAPQIGKAGEKFIEHLANANNDANPELMRLALKLATGAGKTTVMAMLIAWQTINAVRRPQSKRYTRGFLVVAPGITIKDRLRVLHANDPDSYYKDRELVPGDMLDDINRAKIVITNFHAFKLRERRPPPWISLNPASHTEIQTLPRVSTPSSQTSGPKLRDSSVTQHTFSLHIGLNVYIKWPLSIHVIANLPTNA